MKLVDQGSNEMNAIELEPITLLEEIFPGDTNTYGTAVGGKILALMDRAADLAASRYASAHFVTASLDALEFRTPVKQGEIVEVNAYVVYTSRHTCAVKVRVFAVDKTKWEKRPCSQGIFFMVAMGQEGRPLPIMELVPDGPEAKRDWEEARDIHKRMIARMRGSMSPPG